MGKKYGNYHLQYLFDDLHVIYMFFTYYVNFQLFQWEASPSLITPCITLGCPSIAERVTCEIISVLLDNTKHPQSSFEPDPKELISLMAAGNQAYIARYVARLKMLINKTQLIDLLFRLPLIYFTPVDKYF